METEIQFNKELATYTDTSIKLQHTKSNTILGISSYANPYGYFHYHKSPANHTEGNKH
jgi:hypothetical protein